MRYQEMLNNKVLLRSQTLASNTQREHRTQRGPNMNQTFIQSPSGFSSVVS